MVLQGVISLGHDEVGYRSGPTGAQPFRKPNPGGLRLLLWFPKTTRPSDRGSVEAAGWRDTKSHRIPGIFALMGDPGIAAVKGRSGGIRDMEVAPRCQGGTL